MGILDLFRPKWKHSDYDVRRSVVEGLSDQRALLEVARNDKAPQLRLAAATKLTDKRAAQEICLELGGLLNNLPDCKLAYRHVLDQGILATLARTDPRRYARQAAVEELSEPAVLAEVARRDCDPDVRREATRKVTDSRVLAEIAEIDGSPGVREMAVRKLTDAALLAKIVNTDPELFVRKAAIDSIQDEATLQELETVRQAPRPGEEVPYVGAALDEALFRVRSEIVRVGTDQAALARIAKSWTNTSSAEIDGLRQAAVEKLLDQTLLAELAKSDHMRAVREAAAKRLDDRQLTQVVLQEIEESRQREFRDVGVSSQRERLRQCPSCRKQREVLRTTGQQGWDAYCCRVCGTECD